MEKLLNTKLLYVVIFSFATALRIFLCKFALNKNENPLIFIFQAILVSSILLTIYVICFKKEELKKINYLVLKYFIFIGIFVGFTYILGIFALELSNSINYSFLIKSSIIFIIILASIIFKEKINNLKLFLIFTFILGAYLIIVGNKIIIARIGDLLAVLAALCFSITVIIQKSLIRMIEPIIVAWGRVFFAIIIIFIFIYIKNTSILDTKTPEIVIFVGIALTFEAIYLNKTIAISTASYLGMMSMIIPLINFLLGIFFLNEEMNILQIIGTSLIICSGALVQKSNT